MTGWTGPTVAAFLHDLEPLPDDDERPTLEGRLGDQVITRNGGIAGGVVHDLPIDLEAALKSNPQALTTWADLTPIARNEWICWIETAKKSETRIKRINWGCENLQDGKRRPCCWPGCPHRERIKAAAG